jgi:hypothetical protein
MRIQRIERGLRLLTFNCKDCGTEVDVEDIWSVEFGEGLYRTHVCQDCLRQMLLEKEVKFTI